MFSIGEGLFLKYILNLTVLHWVIVCRLYCDFLGVVTESRLVIYIKLSIVYGATIADSRSAHLVEPDSVFTMTNWVIGVAL